MNAINESYQKLHIDIIGLNYLFRILTIEDWIDYMYIQIG